MAFVIRPSRQLKIAYVNCMCMYNRPCVSFTRVTDAPQFFTSNGKTQETRATNEDECKQYSDLRGGAYAETVQLDVHGSQCRHGGSKIKCSMSLADKMCNILMYRSFIR